MTSAEHDSRTSDRSSLHVCRGAVRVALGVAIVVAAIMMLWHWPLAWVPVLIAAVIYGMDLLIWLIDRRARREARLPAMSAEQRDRTLRAAEERVGLRTALVIAGGLASIALLLASIAFDWRLVAIGALVIFAWLGLLGLPFWLAAIGEEAETEHDRLTGESRSIR